MKIRDQRTDTIGCLPGWIKSWKNSCVLFAMLVAVLLLPPSVEQLQFLPRTARSCLG